MRYPLLHLDDVEVGDWIGTIVGGSKAHGVVAAIDRDAKLLNYQDGTVSAFTAYWPEVDLIKPDGHLVVPRQGPGVAVCGCARGPGARHHRSRLTRVWVHDACTRPAPGAPLLSHDDRTAVER